MESDEFQCPRCLQLFKKKYNLTRHLSRVYLCDIVHQISNKTNETSRNYDQQPFDPETAICQYCNIRLKHKRNLNRHYDTCASKVRIASVSPDLHDEINQLRVQLNDIKLCQKASQQTSTSNDDIRKQLEELKKRPPQIIENHNHNHNFLQLVCIGKNDNYLDMLTDQIGFDRAIGFIKDCALSQLSGDCKLLEKIYFENREPNIMTLDRNRSKLEFVDEYQRKVVDVGGVQLRKRLANNLQNSYLKGVNHLIKETFERLDDYDLQSWNKHIYELSDAKYQKKMLSQLNIPLKNDS
jgi:Zn-finger nucleic acid-binding protein